MEGIRENKFPVTVHGLKAGRLSMLSCALKWDPGCQTFLSHLFPLPEVTPRLSSDSSSRSQFSWPCKPYQTHAALNTHLREVKDQGAPTSSWWRVQWFPTSPLTPSSDKAGPKVQLGPKGSCPSSKDSFAFSLYQGFWTHSNCHSNMTLLSVFW